MKKLMINPNSLVFALLTTFTMAIASPALAIDDKKAIPVEMKFIGGPTNQPLFELTFSDTGETEFTITIRDEFRNELYKEQVKGNATKRFLLNAEELNGVDVIFEVTARTHKRVVFEINKSTRMVEDVVVTRMK